MLNDESDPDLDLCMHWPQDPAAKSMIAYIPIFVRLQHSRLYFLQIAYKKNKTLSIILVRSKVVNKTDHYNQAHSCANPKALTLPMNKCSRPNWTLCPRMIKAKSIHNRRLGYNACCMSLSAKKHHKTCGTNNRERVNQPLSNEARLT